MDCLEQFKHLKGLDSGLDESFFNIARSFQEIRSSLLEDRKSEATVDKLVKQQCALLQQALDLLKTPRQYGGSRRRRNRRRKTRRSRA